MERILLITNNEKVRDRFKDSRFKMKFMKIELLDILIYIRDEIHKGHKLLSHPLAGSVKPNETPYKSVLISEKKYNNIDFKSLTIIEDSIKMTEKLFRDKKTRKWPDRILKDFKTIDLELISSAVESSM